jgi:hypothetical protein
MSPRSREEGPRNHRGRSRGRKSSWPGGPGRARRATHPHIGVGPSHGRPSVGVTVHGTLIPHGEGSHPACKRSANVLGRRCKRPANVRPPKRRETGETTHAIPRVFGVSCPCSPGFAEHEPIGVLEALTNQDVLQRLQQLSDTLDRLASSKARPRRSRRHNRILRPGSVLVAVAQVLAAAEEPMPVCDVSTAVSDMLGLPVSRSSVKNCLARRARGENAPFERTDRGRYRLSAARAARSAGECPPVTARQAAPATPSDQGRAVRRCAPGS